MGIEAATFVGVESWVFDPDFEFAVGTDGREEIRVDGRWEPLYLHGRTSAIIPRLWT